MILIGIDLAIDRHARKRRVIDRALDGIGDRGVGKGDRSTETVRHRSHFALIGRIVRERHDIAVRIRDCTDLPDTSIERSSEIEVFIGRSKLVHRSIRHRQEKNAAGRPLMILPLLQTDLGRASWIIDIGIELMRRAIGQLNDRIVTKQRILAPSPKGVSHPPKVEGPAESCNTPLVVRHNAGSLDFPSPPNPAVIDALDFEIEPAIARQDQIGVHEVEIPGEGLNIVLDLLKDRLRGIVQELTHIRCAGLPFLAIEGIVLPIAGGLTPRELRAPAAHQSAEYDQHPKDVARSHYRRFHTCLSDGTINASEPFTDVREKTFRNFLFSNCSNDF